MRKSLFDNKKEGKYNKQDIIAFIIISCLIFFIYANSGTADTGPGGVVEVQLKTGPKFAGTEPEAIRAWCGIDYRTKFPFALLTYERITSNSGSGCPRITLFEIEHEMCWIIGIWLTVKPLFTLSILFYAIFVL